MAFLSFYRSMNDVPADAELVMTRSAMDVSRMQRHIARITEYVALFICAVNLTLLLIDPNSSVLFAAPLITYILCRMVVDRMASQWSFRCAIVDSDAHSEQFQRYCLDSLA